VIRDLFTRGLVIYTEQERLSCEVKDGEVIAPQISVHTVDNFSYVARWEEICRDPMNNTMSLTKMQKGIWQPCDTDADCQIGCKALCRPCTNCKTGNQCVPDGPPGKYPGSCGDVTLVQVWPKSIPEHCTYGDNHMTNQTMTQICDGMKYQWEAGDCKLFEAQWAAYIPPRAMEIMWKCAAAYGQYMRCVSHDPAQAHQMYPLGPYAERNLEAVMYSLNHRNGTKGTNATDFNISTQCPFMLRDLLARGDVLHISMELECKHEDGMTSTPIIHVETEDKFTYIGQWDRVCDDPLDNYMRWSSIPHGLFGPCDSDADCRIPGCSATCVKCHDCEHGMQCQPAPESWGTCLNETIIRVSREQVRQNCRDPRAHCDYVRYDYWEPFGCSIFEDEMHFVVTEHAKLIAPQCNGFVDQYMQCMNRYKFTEPKYYMHNLPGPELRKNLESAMFGPSSRCAAISQEKAARLNAMPCDAPRHMPEY